MLDRTRGKVEAAGLDNVVLVHAGLGERQLDRDSFDRAVLVSVLDEIPEREKALREISGALRSGGLLSIT